MSQGVSCWFSRTTWLWQTSGLSETPLATQNRRAGLVSGSITAGEKFDPIFKQQAQYSCAPECNRDKRTRVKSRPLEGRMHTCINEDTELFYLLPTRNISEGLDSALSGLNVHACPSVLAMTDFIVGLFSWHECGIFGVPNSLQVPFEGGRARTSSNQ